MNQRSLRLSLILPGTLSLALAVLASAAQPGWSDGSPVLRLDERPDIRLTEAASWRGLPPRRWAGPGIWCNRLQDWSVTGGALVCNAGQRLPCRTAHLLTYDLSGKHEPFQLQVTLRLGNGPEEDGFAGFLVGAGEGRLDYRGAALVHHFPGRGGGILAVLETAGRGRAVFRDMSAETNRAEYPLLGGQETVAAGRLHSWTQPVVLNLEGVPAAPGKYDLRLTVWPVAGSGLLAASELRGVDTDRLRGNVALVSHGGSGNVVHAFESFQVGGGRLAHHPERTFGPVAGTLYTVSRRTLKLSAQFMHLGEKISLPPGKGGRRLLAHLEVKTPDGAWEVVDGPKPVAAPDFYVPFRVEGWDASGEVQTRVVFRDADGELYHYLTRIARDPVEKPTVSIAGFTGMGVVGRVASMAGPKPQAGEIVVGRWTPANVWMPFADAVQALGKQEVDLLFFTGDQIYEFKPSPMDTSFEPKNDYLYKWLLWHWSFRALTSRLPAVVQPDDHDVYHGNLWGWGGRLNLTGSNADGGYLFSPYFVNMVHRTQTGHLPDPYDPAPVLNGISNYYTRFNWGGVGFAVLEDRKFKSPGAVTDPAEQSLLGERQKQMLREWGEDWRGQKVKCAVSQTIYASMHVGFDGRITSDKDSNGFPKLKRDEVLRLLRRCGAFVLSGDQHLATFARLGVDQPSDSVYQFAVPAIGNIFWRWFYPAHPGADRQPGAPDYTGEFADGFGNFFRMIAVANPERRSLLSQQLRQRYLIPADEASRGLADKVRPSQGDGYGVVRFHKDTRAITVECWPHNAGTQAGGKQFEGWPVKLGFDQLDGRRPVAWLPDLEIAGAPDPVVQIIDQKTGDVVTSTRAHGGLYTPGVFNRDGIYTLRVGDPDEERPWWTAEDLKPAGRRGEKKLRVDLR